MGIDIHALNFLKYAAKKKRLGQTATIGRQHLAVARAQFQFGPFCEPFLKQELGATIVDSYDFSGFEGATHLTDLNLPLVPEKLYDTIIDCGCTEHIFNVAQALKNISLLCAGGGQIIHVLPANSFCGHGFWQFSPELFFSLYSESHGYSETEVFLADLRWNRHWFEVAQPRNGQRVSVSSGSPLYVLCRTSRLSDFSHEDVQQSDYVHSWESTSQASRASKAGLGFIKKVIERHSAFYRVAQVLAEKLQARVQAFRHPATLSNRNRHLKKRRVSDLLLSK
jgi:hypothetical protein